MPALQIFVVLLKLKDLRMDGAKVYVVSSITFADFGHIKPENACFGHCLCSYSGEVSKSQKLSSNFHIFIFSFLDWINFFMLG